MIPNNYTKNYWSLYLDFLDTFGQLEYKGYALAYLCHYYSLIRHHIPLIRSMKNNSIQSILINKENTSLDVQQRFNEFIDFHKQNFHKPGDGQVVFHDVYNLLRTPHQVLEAYFDPKQTLFIKEDVKKKQSEKALGPYPVKYFSYYSKTNTKLNQIIKRVDQQLQNIFNQYSKHLLFRDLRFQQILKRQCQTIIQRIEETEELIRRENPSCIVVPSTHYPESRTLTIVASAHGIPSICLQHGIIAGEYGYIPKIAAYDAVYGYFEQSWYEHRGVNEPNSLSVIGHPRFDLLQDMATISKDNFYEKLGLDPKKKTILIGVRGKQDYERWRNLVKELISKNFFNIIVRDYPNTTIHPLNQEFPQLFTAKNLNLYQLLHHVDAVIVYPSTVGLEAMLNNIPTFVLDTKNPIYTGYYDSLGDLVQTDPTKLASQILKYFKNKKMIKYANDVRKNFLKEAYPIRDNSTKRLKEWIEKITKEGE